MSPEIIITASISVICAGISAFGGTLFAFKLNTWTQQTKKKQQEASAIRIAQFVLISFIEHYCNLKNQHFTEKLKDSPTRHIRILPIIIEKQNINVPFDKLFFLLDIEPDVVMELHREQSRYELVVSTLETRDSYHLRMQQFVHDSGAEIFDARQIPDVISKPLIELTDTIYNAIDENIESARSLLSDLQTIMKTHYKNEIVIGFKDELFEKTQ